MNKILLTGSSGFVGKNIWLNTPPNLSMYLSVSQYYNLLNKKQTEELFVNSKILSDDIVIHTASKVAGLGGHAAKHTQFLTENTLINLNVLNTAYHQDIHNLIAIGSVAAFSPTKQKLTEETINSGRPHPAEFGYSLSKRYLDDLIQLHRQEHGLNWCDLIPTNIYGKQDNFNLNTAHVIPSLIHKLYLAVKNNTDFEIWGDGRDKRQFIFVEDLVKIIYNLIERGSYPPRLIVANPVTYTIREIVDILVQISGFKGYVRYDDTKPRGLHVRECDTTLLNDLKLIDKFTPLEDGLKTTWNWVNNNYEKIRK